jgi:hypothetical protein
MLLSQLTYLISVRHLATLVWWQSAFCVLCVTSAAATSGMLMLVGSAAAAVLAFWSRVDWYQLVVASRPAPAAAPPRTWLQPVSYLALDFSYFLRVEWAATSLAQYDTFGQWPPLVPFHKSTCTAQHVHTARQEWLSLLLKLAWSYAGGSVMAGGLLWALSSSWVLQELSAAGGSGVVVHWVLAAWAASVKVLCASVVAATAFAHLCCIALQPGYIFLRYRIVLCWAYGHGAIFAMHALVRCLVAAVYSGMLSIVCFVASLPGIVHGRVWWWWARAWLLQL